MKFYEKLVILRKKALLSQEALAEKLDVTRQTVSKWELGQTKPDMDKLSAMSKLFDIDINILTNDEVSLDGIKSDDARIKEEQAQEEIDSFNRDFETWVGTQPAAGASYQIDRVIKNNKKNSSHLIEVVFDGTSYGTDPSSIQSTKNSISTWTTDNHIQYYEVSADYDSNGYINRVTIETR